MHRLNYAFFAAVMSHGLILGYGLRSETFLKVWFALDAAVVTAGLAYRVSSPGEGTGERGTDDSSGGHRVPVYFEAQPGIVVYVRDGRRSDRYQRKDD